MPIIQSRTIAQQLLLRIQQAYQTPHVDSQDEQRENEQLLEQALRAGVTADALVQKAAALARSHGTMRYKLHSLLAGRYWEQTVQRSSIQARGYEAPGPREGGPDFSLEP